MKPLLPVRHENRDFFACDLFDVLPYFKDDLASMEHPVFSLSTKPDRRTLLYEHNENTLKIIPSWLGLPTIHDKDILIYCASYLHAAMKNGHAPSRIVRFTAYDFFVSTNRGVDGRYYKNFETSLNRLRGTTINTNIKTGGFTIGEGFGLIDSWRAVKEDEDGRVIAAEIRLSEWTYNAILANELLTINRDYFRLRKPLERRIYELARKHCGDQPKFKIGLDKLHKKTGSGSRLREFRRMFGKLLETDHLPDYRIALDDEDMVTFINRHKQKAVSSGIYSVLLNSSTFEKAKAVAPGYDIYSLEQEWRIWVSAKQDRPQHPDAAFIAFCRKHFEMNRNNDAPPLIPDQLQETKEEQEPTGEEEQQHQKRLATTIAELHGNSLPQKRKLTEEERQKGRERLADMKATLRKSP